MSGVFWHGAFYSKAFYTDAVIPVVVTNDRGDYPARKKRDGKSRSRRERERLLDQALAKAFEPKRGPPRPKPLPWLAEAVPEPVALPVPEFNPVLAGTAPQFRALEQQLAALQFNRQQEEADIELLLMSL